MPGRKLWNMIAASIRDFFTGRHPVALDAEDGISVSYLTLPSHPFHKYVSTMLNGYGGGILTIRAGSKERAFRIINLLRYAEIASNIGDIRTLVIHPAST